MTGAVARHPKPDLKAKDFRSHHLRPDEMSWQKTRFPGCEAKTLLFDRKSGLMTALMRFAPGAVLPDHEHVNIEQSYVLDAPPRIPRIANVVERTDVQLPFLNLDRLRTTAIRQALEATKGHKSRAARLLGVHPNTLTRMLSQVEDGGARDSLGGG